MKRKHAQWRTHAIHAIKFKPKSARPPYLFQTRAKAREPGRRRAPVPQRAAHKLGQRRGRHAVVIIVVAAVLRVRLGRQPWHRTLPRQLGHGARVQLNDAAAGQLAVMLGPGGRTRGAGVAGNALAAAAGLPGKRRCPPPPPPPARTRARSYAMRQMARF